MPLRLPKYLLPALTVTFFALALTALIASGHFPRAYAQAPTNPTSDAAADWKLTLSQDAAATLQTITPPEKPTGLKSALQITVTKGGNYQGVVSAVRTIPVALKAGQKLTLRFYARATTDTPIRAVFMDQTEQPEAARDLSFTQSLTPDWKPFVCPFTAKRDYKPGEARLLLRVGKGIGTYTFSQIELLNTDTPPQTALLNDFPGTASFANITPATTETPTTVAIPAPKLTPVPVPQPSAPHKSKGPNIIFILCDDLGYGDIGPFGQKHFKTPNLDRMATEGQRWTNHYAASPVCVPTRASLMLGLHTGHLPIRDHQFDAPLPEVADAPNMASVLHQEGYATFSVGKWGVGGSKAAMPAHPMKRGFDKWFGLYSHVDGHVHYPDTQHPIFDGYKDVTAEHQNDYSTDLYTAKAKQYITEQAKTKPDQPFFLYLAYIAPHMAYQVPDSPYPAGQGLKGGVQYPLKSHPDQKNAWIYPDTDPNWTDWQKRYSTMVRRVDDGVGDILQTLRDLNLDENTIVVFTSDNGPARTPEVFQSWGNLDGFKRDLYEGGMREPTIVWWPGTVKPGTTTALPSAHYDWLPTFTELAGGTPPAAWDGISLAPTVTGRGTQKPHDYLYFEFHGPSQLVTDRDVLARHGYPSQGPDPWGNQQAVRIGDYVGLRAQIQSHDTPLRLYNVVTDPHEDKDLANDGNPQHAALLTRMKDRMLTAHRPQPGNPRPYDNAPLPAVNTSGTNNVHIRSFNGTWYWTPDTRTLKPSDDRNAATLTLAGLKNKPGAVEVTGFLTVPQDGAYNVTISLPGRIHLWIHDAHVINGEASVQEPRSGTVPLAKGIHPYRLVVVPADPTSTLRLTVTPAEKTDLPTAPSKKTVRTRRARDNKQNPK